MTNIRTTSLDAYMDISTDGTSESQRMVIFHFIKNHPEGLTRNEISRKLDIKINAVCGRVNELLKFGTIYEDMKRKDEYTQKMNLVLKPSRIKNG